MRPLIVAWKEEKKEVEAEDEVECAFMHLTQLKTYATKKAQVFHMCQI